MGPEPLASPRDSEASNLVIKSSRNEAANTTTIAMDGGQSLRGASFAGASFNFTKGMLGAGILGLPHAVAHCGFGVSCIAGAFLLLVCYLSMVFIVRVCPLKQKSHPFFLPRAAALLPTRGSKDERKKKKKIKHHKAPTPARKKKESKGSHTA